MIGCYQSWRSFLGLRNPCHFYKQSGYIMETTQESERGYNGRSNKEIRCSLSNDPITNDHERP